MNGSGLRLRVVHLRRSTSHAISGREGDRVARAEDDEREFDDLEVFDLHFEVHLLVQDLDFRVQGSGIRVLRGLGSGG